LNRVFKKLQKCVHIFIILLFNFSPAEVVAGVVADTLEKEWKIEVA
jgi:hypothetical protein